jgi:hypothetical protein
VSAHDKFCNSHYPELIPVEGCNWCSSLSKARNESYKIVEKYFDNFPNLNKIHIKELKKRMLDNTKHM